MIYPELPGGDSSPGATDFDAALQAFTSEFNELATLKQASQIIDQSAQGSLYFDILADKAQIDPDVIVFGERSLVATHNDVPVANITFTCDRYGDKFTVNQADLDARLPDQIVFARFPMKTITIKPVESSVPKSEDLPFYKHVIKPVLGPGESIDDYDFDCINIAQTLLKWNIAPIDPTP